MVWQRGDRQDLIKMRNCSAPHHVDRTSQRKSEALQTTGIANHIIKRGKILFARMLHFTYPGSSCPEGIAQKFGAAEYYSHAEELPYVLNQKKTQEFTRTLNNHLMNTKEKHTQKSNSSSIQNPRKVFQEIINSTINHSSLHNQPFNDHKNY